MTIFAIFISLLFAIVFPILVQNKAFTIKPASTSSASSLSNSGINSSIDNYINMQGIYFFLFIGLVILTTILIAASKSKTVKFVSFGIGLISFSYYLNVFLEIGKDLKGYASTIPTTSKISTSSSAIILLILFIVVLLTDTICLLGTAFPKPVEEAKQEETL